MMKIKKVEVEKKETMQIFQVVLKCLLLLEQKRSAFVIHYSEENSNEIKVYFAD
ncbi:MAG: hypothetical protein ACR5KW_01625 [Wolbachia sp.]